MRNLHDSTLMFEGIKVTHVENMKSKEEAVRKDAIINLIWVLLCSRALYGENDRFEFG